MKDVQGLFKDVKYFDGHLWFKIDKDNNHKLVKTRFGEPSFKQFCVVDVTAGKIYKRDDFINEFCVNLSVDEILQKLDTLKFKVYKKIKLKDDF